MDRIPAIRRAILADVPPLQGAAWALVAVAVPTAVRWAIDQGTAGIPFVTYFPAVVLASLMLGWRWGAVVALGSGVLANRLFSHQPLLAFNPSDALLVLLFALSCAVLVGTGEMCRRLLRQLESAQAREELLNHELMHRMKNVLATVNAMAVLTARHSEPGQFTQAFTGRMRALDRATGLLGTGQSGQCEVGQLAEGAVAPFRTDHNFALDGESCELPRDACVPLALALHELCTNAAKHGALTAAAGKVSLSWTCGGEGLLKMTWREQGGPPVPEQRRAGMGTQLLRRQRGLKAVEVRFPRAGLECDIEIEGARPLKG